MNAHDRDHLDTAIDQVAVRLVQVDDDPEMALRIARALPERSRFGWLVPQFALLTALAIAAVVWTLRDRSTLVSPLPASSVGVVGMLPLAALAYEPGTALRTALRTPPLEPLESLEHVEPLASDHEFSLPPLDAMTTLSVLSLAPSDLPVSDAMQLRSIEIDDLALAPEPPFQRD